MRRNGCLNVEKKDIDFKANFKWKQEEHTCIYCKKNIEEINKHLLLCEKTGHIHS